MRFRQELLRQVHDALAPYGFMQEKDRFKRVKADVAQMVWIDFQRVGPGETFCEVRFGVSPFCAPFNAFAWYRLRLLEEDNSCIANGWLFERSASAAMQKTISEIVHLLKKDALPFFRSAETPSCILTELRKTEEHLHQIRSRKSGRQVGECKTDYFLWNSVKFSLAIKTGDLSFAIKCKEVWLDHLLFVLDHTPETDKALCLAEISQLKSDLELLRRGETARFLEEIRQNEKKAQECWEDSNVR